VAEENGKEWPQKFCLQLNTIRTMAFSNKKDSFGGKKSFSTFSTLRPQERVKKQTKRFFGMTDLKQLLLRMHSQTVVMDTRNLFQPGLNQLVNHTNSTT
jgi:hypothetical protein